jgi:uncharacterized protein with HEPN domain
MSRDWRLYLDDLIEACEKIVLFLRERDISAFSNDEMLHDAVVRNLEVIGEAVAHIPDHVKSQAPGIDWVNIKGLRNIIAHRYFELDEDVLWDVAVQEVPDLLAKARALYDVKD